MQLGCSAPGTWSDTRRVLEPRSRTASIEFHLRGSEKDIVKRSIHCCLVSLTLLHSVATGVGQAAPVRSVVGPDIGPTPIDGDVLVEGRWGAAPGEFGTTDDSSRPGPMDFAIHGDALYVLDPVNARVQIFDFDGSLSAVIPITTRTADFMCVDADGSVAVLDAFVKRELRVFAATGELLTTAQLPGALRLPSAVFVRDGEYRVEERHSRVHVLDVDPALPLQTALLAATERGRPQQADAGALHARKLGTQSVVIERSRQHGDPLLTRVCFPAPIRSIVALESDERGHTYLAATRARAAAPVKPRTVIQVIALDDAGNLSGVLTLPDQYVTDHYRKLLITPRGDVIQMQTTEDGVRFIRWSMQAPPTEGGAE